MILALITDYERAVLDRLREDKRLRRLIEGISMLPATPEDEEHTQEIYRKAIREKELTQAEAAAELEHHERIQEEFRLSYKANGYKTPYLYGKGRVKIMMSTIAGREGSAEEA